MLLFAAIRDGKLSDLKNIIESCDDKDMLLYYKDKVSIIIMAWLDI